METYVPVPLRGTGFEIKLETYMGQEVILHVARGGDYQPYSYLGLKKVTRRDVVTQIDITAVAEHRRYSTDVLNPKFHSSVHSGHSLLLYDWLSLLARVHPTDPHGISVLDVRRNTAIVLSRSYGEIEIMTRDSTRKNGAEVMLKCGHPYFISMKIIFERIVALNKQDPSHDRTTRFREFHWVNS